jgi:O-methyltransferase
VRNEDWASATRTVDTVDGFGELMKLVKRIVRGGLRRAGFDLLPIRDAKDEQTFPPDFDALTQDVCRLVRPFTMTSPERVYALRQGIKYVIEHGIQGDIVECGVWKGGSMMAAAMTLQESCVTDRNLHLFDTFDGMSDPTQEDISLAGESAAALLSKSNKESSLVWAFSVFDEVRHNLLSTGYPAERIFFIKGKVEETIPERAPSKIALLRLDTDWYESTYHELHHLYPRLSPGGVLIIDDYGHWAGARKAVDTYFAEHKLQLLLNRIDYTGRICVKN